jgi:hypothetical protein
MPLRERAALFASSSQMGREITRRMVEGRRRGGGRIGRDPFPVRAELVEASPFELAKRSKALRQAQGERWWG